MYCLSFESAYLLMVQTAYTTLLSWDRPSDYPNMCTHTTQRDLTLYLQYLCRQEPRGHIVNVHIRKRRKPRKCLYCFQVLHFVALLLIHMLGAINNSYGGVVEMEMYIIKQLGNKVLEVVIGRAWMGIWLACLQEFCFYLLCIDSVH